MLREFHKVASSSSWFTFGCYKSKYSLVVENISASCFGETVSRWIYNLNVRLLHLRVAFFATNSILRCILLLLDWKTTFFVVVLFQLLLRRSFYSWEGGITTLASSAWSWRWPSCLTLPEVVRFSNFCGAVVSVLKLPSCHMVKYHNLFILPSVQLQNK